MKNKIISLALCLLLVGKISQAAFPPTQIYNEGTRQGVFFNLDCVGEGISCTHSGITGTLNVTGTSGSGDSTTSGWTDVTTRVELVTSTDNVTVGSSINGGKVFIDGDANEVQLQVQSNSTQTTDIFRVENSTQQPHITIQPTGLTSFVDIISPTATITTVTGTLSGNASTATALAANPDDCAAGTVATAIAASGALTCSITPLISGGTLTSANHCRYDGTGIDCDRAEDATATCGANAVCMGGHTHPTTEISGVNAGTDLTADLEEEVTEGSLADSTIVSDDIKAGTLVDSDMANDALDPDKLVGDGTDDDKVDSSIVEQHVGTDISADLEEEVTEGSLADSVIVTGDIKNGTVAATDLNLTDFTCADFTITDCGALTSSGLITSTGLIVSTSLKDSALANCDTIDTDGSGIFKCGTDAGAGGGISNVVEDATPQLGGNLDTQTYSIISPSATIAQTGVVVYTSLSAPSITNHIWDKSIFIENPVAGDTFTLFKTARAITITNIKGIVDPAGTGDSVDVDIRECDATADNCVTIDGTIKADNDGQDDDGSLANPTVDANDWVNINLLSNVGTATQLTVTIYYKDNAI